MRVRLYSLILLIFISVGYTLFGVHINAAFADGRALNENVGMQSAASTSKAEKTPPYLPVYRIKLRVHLTNSGRPTQEFVPIFAEINDIWWSQAGICFEIQAVDHDEPLADGLDMWFAPYIGGFNGYYDGEHIQMTDDPDLDQAPNPAKYSAARTAAHELGHALDLPHRQDSDDNLMRSKTYGWQLSKEEILDAREAAADIALDDATPLACGPARIDTNKQAVKK